MYEAGVVIRSGCNEHKLVDERRDDRATLSLAWVRPSLWVPSHPKRGVMEDWDQLRSLQLLFLQIRTLTVISNFA